MKYLLLIPLCSFTAWETLPPPFEIHDPSPIIINVINEGPSVDTIIVGTALGNELSND
jgi:hypothetical protein